MAKINYMSTKGMDLASTTNTNLSPKSANRKIHTKFFVNKASKTSMATLQQKPGCSRNLVTMKQSPDLKQVFVS
jgi:hypothetical protein